jgi:hypothetical protein
MSPTQGGLPVTTGALTLNILPQLSVIVGAVGRTAAAKQATFDVVFAGITTTGGATVVVCAQV